MKKENKEGEYYDMGCCYIVTGIMRVRKVVVARVILIIPMQKLHPNCRVMLSPTQLRLSILPCSNCLGNQTHPFKILTCCIGAQGKCQLHLKSSYRLTKLIKYCRSKLLYFQACLKQK